MIKIKGYTEKQLEYITNNYQNKTVKQLAEELGKSLRSINYVTNKLNLIKQKHNEWTDDEINFLREHYVDMTSEQISKYINHSVCAINTQRDRLNLARNSSWTDKEIDYLKQNFDKMSHKCIAKKLGKTSGAVNSKCFDLNLYKKELPWEESEIQYIIDNYMEMPTRDISSHLGRTINAVKLKAERMGLKKYPYTCNYHFFDSIDTEEKAYWLGFLSADGWISLNMKNNAGVTGVELQYRDLDHLKKFNKALSGNYRITDRWRTCPLSEHKDKKNHTCTLRIFSLLMYDSLQNLGFTDNKSFDCYIPQFSDELLRHYIRGYFDGNGCFTLTNKSFKVSFVTASLKLSRDLSNKLQAYGFNPIVNSVVSEYGTTIYYVNLNRKCEKTRFLDWIYGESSIYLDRKYKRYIKSKAVNGLSS